MKLFKKLISLAVTLSLIIVPLTTQPALAETVSKPEKIDQLLADLGFTKEEIKGLKKSDEDANPDYNFKDEKVKQLKLKKKDILHLANLGFNKEEIEHMTLDAWNHFKDKNGELISVNTSYAISDSNTGSYKPTTKEVYEMKKAENDNTNGISYALCNPVYGCSGNNSSGSAIKLTVTVTRFNSDTYGIKSDFAWAKNPGAQYSDLFGSGHSPSMTLDYTSIYGYYCTDYYDLNTNTLEADLTTPINGKIFPDIAGYSHLLALHSNSYQTSTGKWLISKAHFGYTFGEAKMSYGTSASAYAYYTNVKTEWVKSYYVSFPPATVGLSVTPTTVQDIMPNAAVSFTK